MFIVYEYLGFVLHWNVVTVIMFHIYLHRAVSYLMYIYKISILRIHYCLASNLLSLIFMAKIKENGIVYSQNPFYAKATYAKI